MGVEEGDELLETSWHTVVDTKLCIGDGNQQQSRTTWALLRLHMDFVILRGQADALPGLDFVRLAQNFDCIGFVDIFFFIAFFT